MNGQVADMFSSMSVAPPDRTARTARTTDLQRSTASRKGFSSVLQKLREVGRQDDRRQDEVSSSQKADERTQVKRTKTKDHSQVRTEQSDSSTKRTENRPQTKETKTNKDSASIRAEEGDASSPRTVEAGSAQHDERRPVDASLTGNDYSGKDNSADSTSDVQAHVFPTWTTLLAQPTDAVLPHQEPISTEGQLQLSQGDGGQPASSSSEPTSASSETVDSWGLTAQTSGPTPNLGGAAVSANAQLQPSVTMSASHTENGKLVGSSPTQDQPLVIDNADVQNTKVSQAADLTPSKVNGDSPGLMPDTLLQKESRLSLDAMLKNSQPESPMRRSDHEGGEGHGGRSLPAHAEGHPSLPEHHESSDLKVKPLMPQGHQPAFNFAEQFSEQWMNEHDHRSEQAEVKVPRTVLADLQGQAGKLPDSLVVGALGSPSHSAQVASPSSSGTVAQAQPGLSTQHLADQPTPAMMKAVVLSVTQPDLGQVNVRVAMTNDIVHTHLSTDRPEVGQFLLNGQDRLQSSLQMNGFDMGQFRVDIDRQGAGRSFQQGFSQEQQGQAGNQDSPWREGERVTHPYDDVHASRHGRLNVMA